MSMPPPNPLDASGFLKGGNGKSTPPEDAAMLSALNKDEAANPDPLFDPSDNPMADSYESATLGKLGDELHDSVVRSIVEQESYLRGALAPTFQRFTRYWRLYLSQKDDKRKEGEQWRANVVVPYAYSGVRTMVAAVSDIFNSAEPLIQPDAVAEEHEEDQKAVTRILDYQMRMDRWNLKFDKGLTDAGIQGTWLPKLIHGKRSQRVYVVPNSFDLEDWEKRVHEAEQNTGMQAPDIKDMKGFEIWRNMVNQAKKGKVPEFPMPGFQEIIEYSGPMIAHDPVWQYRYDPFVDDIQMQDVVIHRVVKPKQWWIANSGHGPDKMFDPDQVMVALGEGVDRDRFSEWQNQVAAMMGLAGTNKDPRYEQAAEGWEVWRKDAQHPYLLLLNRKAVINKPDKSGCYSNPFWHGRYPLFPVHNVPVAGYAHGISEIAPNEPLYHEMNSMRDLRLDAVTLRVLPIFMRMTDSQMPELSRLLQPGMVLPVSRPEGIRNLMDGGMQGVDAAFREIDYIKQDIDETNATPPALRGGAATVGRVSATESERRFSQALVRQKQRVLTIEEGLKPFVDMSLFLWYQFHSSGERIRVGGDDPFVTVRKSMFQEALGMDYRFRGASKALNRDMAAQQLEGFGKLFMPYMVPKEVRALMKRIYDTIGQKGVAEIVSDEGTAQLVAQQAAQQAAAQAPQPGAAPGAPGAPGAAGAPQDPTSAAPQQLQGDAATAMISALSGAGTPQ